MEHPRAILPADLRIDSTARDGNGTGDRKLKREEECIADEEGIARSVALDLEPVAHACFVSKSVVTSACMVRSENFVSPHAHPRFRRLDDSTRRCASSGSATNELVLA